MVEITKKSPVQASMLSTEASICLQPLQVAWRQEHFEESVSFRQGLRKIAPLAELIPEPPLHFSIIFLQEDASIHPRATSKKPFELFLNFLIRKYED